VGREFSPSSEAGWSLLELLASLGPRDRVAEMPRAGVQIGETKMIARSLIRRLEHLESRFQPPVGEPIILNIQFVDKDLISQR
jgi:hypothetical protein